MLLQEWALLAKIRRQLRSRGTGPAQTKALDNALLPYVARCLPPIDWLRAGNASVSTDRYNYTDYLSQAHYNPSSRTAAAAGWAGGDASPGGGVDIMCRTYVYGVSS